MKKLVYLFLLFALVSGKTFAGVIVKSSLLYGKNTDGTPQIRDNAVIDVQDDYYNFMKQQGLDFEKYFVNKGVQHRVYLEFLNENERIYNSPWEIKFSIDVQYFDQQGALMNSISKRYHLSINHDGSGLVGKDKDLVVLAGGYRLKATIVPGSIVSTHPDGLLFPDDVVFRVESQVNRSFAIDQNQAPFAVHKLISSTQNSSKNVKAEKIGTVAIKK